MPELWPEIAEETGVEELRLTTREVSDTDSLMKKRLSALKENGLSLDRLQRIAGQSQPLEGAAEFLRWSRQRMPVMILSDVFWELVSPLLAKMEYPTILCNSLNTDENGFASDYYIRPDGKRRTVAALREAGLKVTAIGDSYNDIKMLQEADNGFLFNASEEVAQNFPDLPSLNDYRELKDRLVSAEKEILN